MRTRLPWLLLLFASASFGQSQLLPAFRERWWTQKPAKQLDSVEPLLFKLNSRLLIVRGCPGERFKLIRRVPAAPQSN